MEAQGWGPVCSAGFLLGADFAAVLQYLPTVTKAASKRFQPPGARQCSPGAGLRKLPGLLWVPSLALFTDDTTILDIQLLVTTVTCHCYGPLVFPRLPFFIADEFFSFQSAMSHSPGIGLTTLCMSLFETVGSWLFMGYIKSDIPCKESRGSLMSGKGLAVQFQSALLGGSVVEQP